MVISEITAGVIPMGISKCRRMAWQKYTVKEAAYEEQRGLLHFAAYYGSRDYHNNMYELLSERFLKYRNHSKNSI